MLGRVDPQGSLFEPEHLFGDLVTRGSFHDKLAVCGHERISDDDFVGLYALNRGRPSIPPSLMMRGLLLAVKDDTSDRESARRSRVDLDWKHALGVASDFPGIGPRPSRCSGPGWCCTTRIRPCSERRCARLSRKGCSRGRSWRSSTPPRCWEPEPSRTPTSWCGPASRRWWRPPARRACPRSCCERCAATSRAPSPRST